MSNKLISSVKHTNGGIEQALLQIAKDEGCLSKEDSARLEELKALPQNRTEVRNQYSYTTPSPQRDIKDYLPFYLGAKCLWRFVGDSAKEWRHGGVDIHLLDRLLDRQPIEVKPILYPISTMPREDLDKMFKELIDKDCEFLPSEHFEDFKSWLWHYTSEGIGIEDVVPIINYLRDKWFDCDNLIPEGLAIDATTLDNQQTK